MSIRNILLTSCMMAFAGGTAAVADCAEELAALKTESGAEGHSGISKDGSLAPLQESTEADAGAGAEGDADVATAGTTGAASTEAEAEAEAEIAKDGSVAPMQEDASDDGNAATIAVSGEDAQRQQEAASAGAAEEGREAALQRAEAALDAGDEAGCMEAVEEARSL